MKKPERIKCVRCGGDYSSYGHTCWPSPSSHCYALALTIARAIFAAGDEPDSPCNRIQFKGGQWPDNERNQGGLSEEPLAKLIAAQLEAHNDKDQATASTKL